MRLLPALLLSGCASPLVAPVERADRAAEDRIAQVERASRDLIADADRRAEARVTQVREELSDEIGELVENFDERITAHRVETIAALKAEREAIVSAFREESSAWRTEAAAWRTEVGTIRASLVGPAPAGGAAETVPGAPAEHEAMTWAGVAALAFTVGKTAFRWWRAHKAAEAA